MENSNSNDYEERPLINELTLAKELVHQLRFHLSPTSSSTGEILIEKILSSYDKALMMLNWNNNNRSEAETLLPTPSFAMIESPQSAGSPRSEDSDIRDIFYKKRKTMPRWTEQVRVCSGNGTEGPQEDGHSWRKYGQKDILGAKYPRGYYRCTHRHVQGCLATKQVQRSDEDPFVFDVTYRGKHTCNPSFSPLLQASQALCKGDQTHNPDQLLEQRKRKQSEEMLQKIRAGLTVKTENPDIREQTSSPFSFPSIMSTECIKSENNIFSPVSLDNSYMGCYSPFISPATSESNYFSPCHINSIARKQPFRTSESDLNEIVSAATSASNSPVMDLEFTLDSLDFDSNFPFHNSSFFS